MPRNNQGVYSLPAGNPVIPDTLIESTWANSTMEDVGAALTGSLPRNGTSSMTGPLVLSGNATQPLEAIPKQQLDSQLSSFSANMPAFSASLYSNQVAPNGSWGKVLCSTVGFDTSSAYNAGNARFQPLIAGYYQINGVVFVGGSGPITITAVAVYKNGVAVAQEYSAAPNISGGSNSTSTVIYMNGVSDYVELYGYIQCAGSPAFGGNVAGNYSKLSGSMVRANSLIPTITASAVTNVPAGNIQATNVQTALNELDSEKASTSEVALKAPLISPVLTGTPIAPTVTPSSDNSTKLATTAFVQSAIAGSVVGVSSWNTRTGAVVLTSGDVNTALGYTPASDTSVALKAPMASPALTGTPTAPTAAPGTNTTQLATTAFALAAAGVTAFNSRTGSVNLTTGDVTSALTYIPSNIDSPTFTGVPAAPTAAPGTSTTQLATTNFVTAAIAGSVAGVASFNTRTGAVTLTSGDVTGALTYTPANPVSPALTGTPTAPTATNGTNTTQIATTAFVIANAAGAGVASFNTRTGAVTLINSDVTAALTYTPENSSLKNVLNGYVGLSSYSIQFKNAANSFTSLLANANTAARTYTFQDKTGTIADLDDLALKGSLDGNNNWTKSQRAAPLTFAYAATVTLDFSLRNNFYSAALTSNLTLANPTNVQAGQSGQIEFLQDATGGRTITSYGSLFVAAGGVKPNLTALANGRDVLFYTVLSTGQILISASNKVS